ncbi:MAG TPA: ion transporter [Alphaproteobacteria bacterium]|nr:ion transporter [Alphaproteobacteria bacterium]USO05527.1 MAG: ion transporter [Rhodospirillales bacterium]HOO82734.1 ion transporter [Alphaproteobacteria bacterium]
MEHWDLHKIKDRHLVYKHLVPSAWDKPKPSPVTHLILILILFSLILFTLETELSFQSKFETTLTVINMIVAVLFGIEYGLRVWTCVENPKFQGKWGRLKFALTPLALIDLVAFLPTLIFIGDTSTYWLRIVRVVRILRLLKLGRYSSSIKMVVNSIRKSWRELVVTFCASLFFLYLSAVLLYFVESDAQPEGFGSIPRAIWWAVATLTTVGYGDVYPITALGKLCAGIIALIGVAIVALPAGILAGSFIEEFKNQRDRGER